MSAQEVQAGEIVKLGIQTQDMVGVVPASLSGLGPGFSRCPHPPGLRLWDGRYWERVGLRWE